MGEVTRIAMLAGASGLVGRSLLAQALSSGRYATIHALVRKPLGLSHPALREHVVTFENLGEWPGLDHADDCFCCLGTTIRAAGSQAAFRKVDYEFPVELARLAKRLGAAKYLLVSAMGADAGSAVFYNRVKGEVEAAIGKAGVLSVDIFRPSLLLGHRTQARKGERTAEMLLATLKPFLRGPLRPYRSIEASAVARAMLRASERKSTGIRVYDSRQIQEIADGGPVE